MNLNPDSPHATLGVARSASNDEIQQAWRDLTKVWHPDRFVHESPRLQQKAQDKLKQINAAYDTLRRKSNFGSPANRKPRPSSKESGGRPLSPFAFYGVATLLTLVCLRAGLLFRSGWTTIITIGIILIFSALAARAFQNAFFKH